MYLTVVFKDIEPGSKECAELVYHPNTTACSWSHALQELELLRSSGNSRRLSAKDVDSFLEKYDTKERALNLLQEMGFIGEDGELASPYST